MDWNKNTKIKYIGAVSQYDELESGVKTVNEFLEKKGERIKDVRMSSTMTRNHMPYISWMIIYED